MDIRTYLKRSCSGESESVPSKRRAVDSSEAETSVDSRAETSAYGGAACVEENDSSVPKHATGYNVMWEKDFPWLVPKRNEAGVVDGMFCS